MRYKILFSLILLIAIVARFYKLGSIPTGLTWDEAAIGYNAYGLVTNHRDEWLHRTPIVFQSFGDYKSPLLIYITAVFVAVMHLTPWVVRLPVALSGVGVVILSFFVMREILRQVDSEKNPSVWQRLTPYFVMFSVAISPWALVFSRVGFESTLAVFLTTLGVFGWLYGRKNPWWIVIGDVSFVLSLYAYHSPKVVVPLFALILLRILYRSLIQQKKMVLIGTVVALLLVAPLGYATVFGKANSRAVSTTILASPHLVQTFVSNYVTHLSPSFLLFGKDLNYRQSTREMGVLYPIELLLFLSGIVAVISQKKWRKLWWIPMFFFIGLIPAALGIDVPHSNRALMAYPWMQLTEGIGFLSLMSLQFSVLGKNKRNWSLLLGSGVLLAFLWSFASFIHTYGRVYQSSSALSDFGYGYAEAVAYAKSQESSVQTIYFTNHYGQAYIYLLFYKQLTPIEYQGGGLANYTITDHAYADSRGRANTLVIGTPDEFPEGVISVKDIKYPDGKIVFRIVKQ